MMLFYILLGVIAIPLGFDIKAYCSGKTFWDGPPIALIVAMVALVVFTFAGLIAYWGGGGYVDGLQEINGKTVYCTHTTVSNDISWYAPWSHTIEVSTEDMTCKELVP